MIVMWEPLLSIQDDKTEVVGVDWLSGQFNFGADLD